VTLEHLSERGPTHNDPRLVNVRHFPRLAAGRHDSPAVHELVGGVSRDRAISAIWEGSATLELLAAANEEHAALARCASGAGSGSASPTRSTTSRPCGSGVAPAACSRAQRTQRERADHRRRQRIGAACARRFAGQGDAVAVNGRRAAPLEALARELGGVAICGDCSDPAEASRIVATAVRELGGLDCVVLNAGSRTPGRCSNRRPRAGAR